MNKFDILADLSLAILSKRSQKQIANFQEPDYTAALVTVFPQLLNICGLYGCKYGGCFVHQKPKVHFNSTVNGGNATCESGDLLVLLKQTIDGTERFNATLFQLKMHNDHSKIHNIREPRELIQKELYAEWPVFTINKKGTQITYDIHPKTITPGALYMVVRHPFPLISSYPYHLNTIFHNSVPCNHIELSNYCLFGNFLSKFINWQTGRPISASNAITDDWSKFIWEFINTSKTSIYNRRNVKIQNEQRANGDFFSFMIDGMVTTSRTFSHSDLFSFYHHKNRILYQLAEEITIPPSVIEGNDNAEDEFRGISTLYIEAPNDERLM